MGRLGGEFNDGCESCLTRPQRGPAYLRVARRVRSDKAFALACYDQCGSDLARQIFVDKFGFPEGVQLESTEVSKPPAQVIKFRPKKL